MRKERKGEYKCENGNVIDFEIREIFSDAGCGFGDRVGPGHGGSVYKLVPWAALREALADGNGDAREECAESGSCYRGLGI